MSILFFWLNQLLNYHTFCDFSLTRSCKTYSRPVLPPCGRSWQLIYLNRTAHIRQQCRKTTILNFPSCVAYTGFEKMNQHLNIDYNFDHQMSLSKNKCWYSSNCLHF